MIKIAIFDDHPIVLNSLQQVIANEKNMDLLFTSIDKKDFIEFINLNSFLDVVIIDYLADQVVGTEVFDFVLKHHPTIKVIAFTSLSSSILIDNLFSIGVSAYVNKNQEIDDLIHAINLVYNNKKCIPEKYAFILSRYELVQNKQLTPREIEIINLITREFNSNDIADFLGISVNTVETHRKQIFQKLNVKNVAGMVREAITLGYINQ
jgi:DNA-binding NarL/FixJ family response regulator